MFGASRQSSDSSKLNIAALLSKKNAVASKRVQNKQENDMDFY